QQVVIGEGAVIEASGAKGGGEIFAGGGFQGGDPALRNAETTTIGSGTRFNVEAAQSGDAGRVIVWADGATAFGGQIDATANGSDGGAGGFVEVSGKQTLQYRGLVDLRSESGPNGTLLLDPTRIIIIDGPAGGAADSAQVADGVIQGLDGGAVDFTITTGDIAAVGGNVLLQATTEVTDNGANLSVSVDGDFAVSAGGNIDLGGTDITANGHQVTFVSSAGGVNFNTIDTSGFLPGDDGGDVTIFAGNGNIGGNGIDASGEDGGLGDPNGGDGGDIVMDDVTGGNAISFGTIDNSGGNGANGNATTPGGNGGNGGFISFGNTSGNPSSFGPAPPIIYGGGNGGNGNPPGSGGLGGEAFFNNGTIIPDNEAPDGQSGTDLAGSGNSGGGGGISMASNPNRGSGLGGGNFIGINNDIANPTAPFNPNRNFSATHIQPERDREEVEFGSEEFQDRQIDNAIRESRRKREDKRNALMLMVVAKAAGEGGIANIDLEGGINAMQDIDPADIKVVLAAAGGEVTFGPKNEDGSGTIVATVGDKAVIGTVTHNDDGTISVTGAKAVDLKTAEGRALVESVKSSLEVPAADGGGFFGHLLRQHENRGGATNGGN
ncbi:MAG: hypothetical protein KDL87_13635, partial [Verrucomicrobiae bacterium]|nr:hypothetical protein [Verrucomicrobiae bacterium]